MTSIDYWHGRRPPRQLSEQELKSVREISEKYKAEHPDWQQKNEAARKAAWDKGLTFRPEGGAAIARNADGEAYLARQRAEKEERDARAGLSIRRIQRPIAAPQPQLPKPLPVQSGTGQPQYPEDHPDRLAAQRGYYQRVGGTSPTDAQLLAYNAEKRQPGYAEREAEQNRNNVAALQRFGTR